MTKYLLLYNSPSLANEQMADFTEEQIKASMKEWMEWKSEVEKTAKLEFGLPLEIVNRLTTDGFKEISSEVSGYALVEGNSKEEVFELLKSHPHLKRPGTSIDIFEMLPLPEM